jgi:uncharacterized protein (TIGR02996 family)
MLQDEALRLMIQERPDDLGPRLVYADWLEERGQCERAELIRLQCQGDDEDRVAELVRRHGVEWAGPIARLAYSYKFRRGFIEEVAISGLELLKHGDRIFSLAPVRLVRLIGARLMMERLIEWPLLDRIEALHLTGGHLADEGVELLACCRRLSNLRTLRLGQNAIGDTGVEILAASPHLGALEDLVLHGNLIGDVGAHALAIASNLRSLRTLDLSDNQIGEMGGDALSASDGFPCLERLDISHQFKGWSRGLVRGLPLPIQLRQQQTLSVRFGADVCVF